LLFSVIPQSEPKPELAILISSNIPSKNLLGGFAVDTPNKNKSS